jgi:hypothetical protein
LFKIGDIGLLELILNKQFMKSNLLERMNAQNLQGIVKTSEQFSALLKKFYHKKE